MKPSPGMRWSYFGNWMLWMCWNTERALDVPAWEHDCRSNHDVRCSETVSGPFSIFHCEVSTCYSVLGLVNPTSQECPSVYRRPANVL